MPGPENGSQFLNNKYPDLQHSREVSRAVSVHIDNGGKNPYTGPQKIDTYLDRLESIVDNPDLKKRQRGERLLSRMVIDHSVIHSAEDIPESYFENQKRIAEERGYGDIEITDSAKEIAAETIRHDQEKSLSRWTDYLLSDETQYPTWFKYYALRNVIKMSEYDKTNKSFGKRSSGTTKSFPDLNREALAEVFDILNSEKDGSNTESNAEIEKLRESANFSKIYQSVIEKNQKINPEQLGTIEGDWVKFDKDSEPKKLSESLQGYNTGWCVAGEGMADNYLKGGDFYVYYSKDSDGNYTIPRSAIAMNYGRVKEVRGVANDQNIESEMLEIAKEKYSELPGGKKFEKKDADMRYLTEILNKLEADRYSGPLSKEELKFLYEINGKIEGFGHEQDPRIKRIKNARNKRKDIAFIYDKKPEEISFSTEEVFGRDDIKLHLGDLDLSKLTNAKNWVLPEEVLGDVDLTLLGTDEKIEGLVLPKKVGGRLKLSCLEDATGVIFPKEVGDSLVLSSLEKADNLTFPEYIGGSLVLSNLKKADNLTFPEYVGGEVELPKLKSAENLVLPKEIGLALILDSISSLKGIKFPEKVGLFIILSNQTILEGTQTLKNVCNKFYPSRNIYSKTSDAP